MVARFVRDEEAAGSNPVTPTNTAKKPHWDAAFLFSIMIIALSSTYQMQAILVSAIGGVDPNGGEGNIVGVVIAIVLLQMLQSGFTILGFEPYIKKLIWGAVLVGVMMLNYVLVNRKKKAA